MKKKKAEKIISNLTKDKKEIINKKLLEILLLINSVEFHLRGTELQNYFLIPDEKEPTLWTQFYSIEQMFRN